MSKKITHEEVKEAIDKHTWLTGKLADWSGHDWSELDKEYDFIKNENIIIKYIYQQEKLLELYKEYFNTTETIFELNKYVKLSIPNDIRKNYHKKLEQIKELEKE